MTLTRERLEALVAALSGSEDLLFRFAAASLRAQGADQCWHQASWEAGGYDGGYHADECAVVACDEPCLLCQAQALAVPLADALLEAAP